MTDIFSEENRVLFREVLIVGGEAKPVDVFVENGKISRIGVIEKTPQNTVVINLDGAYISPGWADIHVHLREPGREDEETIESGCNAAMAGGFTAVCCMPNTEPPIDSADMLTSVLKTASGHLVDVHPIGAITKGRGGKELSEMGDMVEAGAVAFSDDGDPLESPALMRHALEYSHMFDVPIINHSEVRELSRDGVMHEGIVSTRLGLPGIPEQSEDIMVASDIRLLELAGGRLHVPHVSAASSLELIRRAKKKGLPVTCEVTPHHFSLNDSWLTSFDSNLKIHPPLRTEDDRQALLAGLSDGTIDAIATDHAPHALEEKEADILEAPSGIIGLETAFSLAVVNLLDTGILKLEKLVDKLSTAPRKILNLPEALVREGAPANFTFFDITGEWTVDAALFRSRSRNMPFNAMKLKGKVRGVMNRNRLYLAE